MNRKQHNQENNIERKWIKSLMQMQNLKEKNGTDPTVKPKGSLRR